MHANGHHGYPQPEDTWELDCFKSACVRCGLRGNQSTPLRIRQPKAPHSHVIQLNWLFDVFLFKPDVLDFLLDSGLFGMSSMNILNHKSRNIIDDRVQLYVHNSISCVETSLLPKVTCRPNNEESKFTLLGPKKYPPSTPFCGSVKSHPPTKIVLNLEALHDAPDIFLSEEWFGSGGQAFRLTICSERFVTIFSEQRFRGVSFEPVFFDGVSMREMHLP